MAKGFRDSDVPDQSGRTFVVTGSNTGLGFEAAQALAGKGARVVLACRTRSKAEAARAQIERKHPGAEVGLVDLDLGDLASVHKAAQEIKKEKRLDVLINNAGVMMPPSGKTADGFETQFGTNHIGPFALTGLLLDKLEDAPAPRVVNTSSNGHKMAKVDFTALNAEKGYSAFGQYALSKICNLLHAYELQRRLSLAGRKLIVATAHPGGSDTDLGRHMPKMAQRLMFPVLRPFLNTAAAGAWPTLMAATSPDVRGGEYFGPKGVGELAGPAVKVDSNKLSKNPEVQMRMWDVSVKLSGVDYKI